MIDVDRERVRAWVGDHGRATERPVGACEAVAACLDGAGDRVLAAGTATGADAVLSDYQ